MCESQPVHVAVIGLGLIGGSLLRALAAHGHEVTGYDVSPETRAAATALAAAPPTPAAATEAPALGTGPSMPASDAAVRPSATGVTRETAAGGGLWRIADSIAEALEGAELAVIAVPLPALPDVAAALVDFPGLVTDVTSVKVPVRKQLASPRFVGGHPMAGKESSSFLASDPRLFDGCAWVLCLEPGETDLDAWLTLAALFTGLGARVVPATATEHDQAVARISHVPHLLATALSDLLDGRPLAGALAAGSFRDGTRVAATRTELIAAMCGGNAEPSHEVLTQVIAELEGYRTALSAPDPIAALAPLLERPGTLRRAWPPSALTDVTVPADPAALLALGRAGGWITGIGATIAGKRPETDRISS